jgi:hypothetical protein
MELLIVKKDNERHLLELAKDYELDDFILVYDLDSYCSKFLSKKSTEFIGLYKKGILIESSRIKDIKKAISISDYVIVKAGSNLRDILEKFRNLFVYGFEFNIENDFIHFRNSGLNHVLVKIAKENNINFLFNFQDFLAINNRKKAIVLGRIKQNLKMCDKLNVNYLFMNFIYDKYDLKRDLNLFKKLLKNNRLEFLY